MKTPKTNEEYEAAYQSAIINKEHLQELKIIDSKILKNSEAYDKVDKATAVPWWVVACVHYRESSLSFKCHLHNGDSLQARTHNVPAGRPKLGVPPFEWAISAIDALGQHGHDKWTLGYSLQWLESFNGLGYRTKGLMSPYLWSYTDLYTQGKYSSDGKYDPKLTDKQAGCVSFLKVLGITLSSTF